MLKLLLRQVFSYSKVSVQAFYCNRINFSFLRFTSIHDSVVKIIGPSYFKKQYTSLSASISTTSAFIFILKQSLKHFKKKKFKKYRIMNAPELDLNYFISTGEFAFEDSSSSLTEEQKTSFFLRQLRHEEFVEDGLKKKRECECGKDSRLCIKVMSYNVLSQQLLDQHRYLYRTQNASVLRWEYRHPRILAEIVAEDPDIICLQEVQESHMDSFYRQLEEIGYQGVYKKRTGGKVDGCAVYFRACLFDIVDWSAVEYFQPRVSVLNRDNVGLVVRLKTAGGDGEFVVATTHLLYNPKRHDVRIAQIQLLLAEIHRLANDNGKEIPVILTGDLNAQPDSQVVKFICEGQLHHQYPPLPSHLGILSTCTHADVASPQLYSTQRLEETSSSTSSSDEAAVSVAPPVGIGVPDSAKSPGQQHVSSEICHNFTFQSAYSFKNGEEPVATTFQDQWVTVDYIFYSCSDQIELLSRLRLPTKEECTKFVKNLPNFASPSDHLPLVATFAIKTSLES